VPHVQADYLCREQPDPARNRWPSHCSSCSTQERRTFEVVETTLNELLKNIPIEELLLTCMKRGVQAPGGRHRAVEDEWQARKAATTDAAAREVDAMAFLPTERQDYTFASPAQRRGAVPLGPAAQIGEGPRGATKIFAWLQGSEPLFSRSATPTSSPTRATHQERGDADHAPWSDLADIREPHRQRRDGPPPLWARRRQPLAARSRIWSFLNMEIAGPLRTRIRETEEMQAGKRKPPLAWVSARWAPRSSRSWTTIFVTVRGGGAPSAELATARQRDGVKRPSALSSAKHHERLLRMDTAAAEAAERERVATWEDGARLDCSSHECRCPRFTAATEPRSRTQGALTTPGAALMERSTGILRSMQRPSGPLSSKNGDARTLSGDLTEGSNRDTLQDLSVGGLEGCEAARRRCQERSSSPRRHPPQWLLPPRHRSR
jgi:hypothetical protein